MKPYYISVDIEASGPAPSTHNLISIGAVAVADLTQNFYVEMAPRNVIHLDDPNTQGALKVTGFTVEQLQSFMPPGQAMARFRDWVNEVTPPGHRATFVSDNPVFDGLFIVDYFWRYTNSCPFGWSGLSLTSFYKGYAKSMRASFKHLRVTKHTHNALDDATGNAEALQTLLRMLNQE